MTDIRVEKILVGTPTYKVVVGNITKVKKVIVGVPTRNVLISNSVLLDDVVGIDTTNNTNGDLLVYNELTGNYENTKVLRDNQVIDGLVYERDSDHGYILIRRSPTVGQPTYLRAGELAYSYLGDFGSYLDGFGNGGDRLYLGIGSDQTELASRIDVIGGKYFTSLLDHEHGILTASSAVIVDSAKRINEWFTDNLVVYQGATIDSAYINNLTVNNLNVLGIANNLREGEAIDITIDSVITISAELATYTNLGVSSYDSSQFLLSSGAVTVNNLDGGFFAYDPTYG